MFRKALSILRKTLLVGLMLAAVGTLALGIWTSDMPWNWVHPLHRDRTLAPAVVPRVSEVTLHSGGIEFRFDLLGRIKRGLPRDTWEAAGFYLSDRTCFRVFKAAKFPSAIPAEYFVRSLDRVVVPHRSLIARAPLWSVLLMFSTYPLIAFIRGPIRRWRRRRKVLCIHCGYDLRGTPERCPECGEEDGKP